MLCIVMIVAEKWWMFDNSNLMMINWNFIILWSAPAGYKDESLEKLEKFSNNFHFNIKQKAHAQLCIFNSICVDIWKCNLFVWMWWMTFILLNMKRKFITRPHRDKVNLHTTRVICSIKTYSLFPKDSMNFFKIYKKF